MPAEIESKSISGVIPVRHTEDDMAYDLLEESAVIPPEVQHQIPQETV